MPAESKAQFRYMQGVAHGSIKPKSGLTRAKATEFVAGQSPKGLPEHKGPRAGEDYAGWLKRKAAERKKK